MGDGHYVRISMGIALCAIAFTIICARRAWSVSRLMGLG
jgi:hypothetical protein